MLYLLLATYGTIFFTELVGDKTIYTISSLTSRFNSLPIFCGAVIAFMSKMLAAVLLGQVVAELPANIVMGVTAGTFFITALFLWFKKQNLKPHENQVHQGASRAIMISFAAIFFSEWGDSGQIAAAALTARYKVPLIIWMGATLALATKGLLSILLGFEIKKRIPQSILRPVSSGLCLLMGIASLLRVWI